MAQDKPRKKPVRTAPARKDYATEVEWLQAKLDHAQKQAAEADQAKVARVEKRIATRQKVIAALTAELRSLEAERDELLGVTREQTETA